MSTLEFLQQRKSVPANLLQEPAPDDDAIREIVTAGIAAPDHAAVRPWRVLVIRGDARKQLGGIFRDAARLRDPSMSDAQLDSMAAKPLRSPLILAVIADVTPDHPKAPRVEQLLSAGAMAQQMLLAANAMGFGSVWLTGPNAGDAHVKQQLGLKADDEIVGFIYLGTPRVDGPEPRRPAIEDHLEFWGES